jgi:hypothetical protein
MQASGFYTAFADHAAESLGSISRSSSCESTEHRPRWRVAEALEYGIVGINAGAAVSTETLDHLRSKLAVLIGLQRNPGVRPWLRRL